MAIAIRIWRVASWIVGCVFILPTALLIWMDIREYEWRHPAAIALFGLYFLACLLAPISAIGIKRATWWARPVGWIAASVQTLAAPIFTPLGIFGLILLYCGAGKAGPRPESSRLWQRASTVPSTVIGMVVVMMSIDLSFRWAKHLGYPDTPNLVITLLILWTCIPLQLVIHEAGHGLAVMLMHGHIHQFQIGPLCWRWESGRSWREFTRKIASAGSVRWTPGSADRLVRQRLLITAAGPFANLVTALTAVIVFLFLGKLGVPQLWPWAMFLGSMGFTLLTNLWPTTKGSQNSDGATIFGILGNADFRRLTEITLVQGMSDSSKLRPSEWKRADLEWALGLEDVPPCSSHRSSILLAGCSHYLDSGDISEAVQCARRFQTLAAQQGGRCTIDGFPDATFTLAFYGGDLEAARELWARRPMRQPQFELAGHLAMASIAGEDRPAAILRAWKCSELYGSCGTLEYLREQLRRLEITSLMLTPTANLTAECAVLALPSYPTAIQQT